jgi:hypothetical protein
MKVRKSIRKELEPLERWVNFANSPKGKETPLRGLLDTLAWLQQDNREHPSIEASPRSIQVPPLNRRIVITETHVGLEYDEDEFYYFEEFLSALNRNVCGEEAWRRLRLCPCDRLFLAANVRAQCCGCVTSNRLKQKEFYQRNTAEQRQIKLARYHANRLRLTAAPKVAAKRGSLDQLRTSLDRLRTSQRTG